MINKFKLYCDPTKGLYPCVPTRYLVSDRKSDYEIIIPDNAGVCTEFAAQELQYFIQEVSGVKLEIHREADAIKDRHISVGETQSGAFLKTDKTDLNGDGFKIFSMGESIYIKGGYEKATLYGTYDFIEKVLGVKFVTDDCIHIPKRERIELPKMRVVEIPDFETRGYFSHSIIKFPLHAARMRMTCQWDTDVEKYGGGWLSRWTQNELHSTFRLLPQTEYVADHPNWYDYAAHDIMPDGSIRGGQLCLTNGLDDNDEYDETKDSNLKQLIENLKKDIINHPKAEYFMVGQMDGHFPKPCERCKRAAKRNGGFGGLVMIFTNVIAKKIEEWAKEAMPGRRIVIVTFAYNWSSEPPVKKVNGQYIPVNEKVIARDNVATMLIPRRKCMYHKISDQSCPFNIEGIDSLYGWAAVNGNLMVWEHVTNFLVHYFYFPHLTTIKDNLKEYKKSGVKLVLSQVGCWESRYYNTLLNCYIYSKLMWNVEQDVGSLVREFNLLYYGEKYSKYVEEYLSFMESFYLNLDEKKGFHTCGNLLYEYGRSDFLNPEHYPIDFLTSAKGMIEKAMRKAEEDDSLSSEEKKELRKRFLRILVTPEMMILWNYGYYYKDGRKEFAEKVIGHLEELDVIEYGERRSVKSLKEMFLGGECNV